MKAPTPENRLRRHLWLIAGLLLLGAGVGLLATDIEQFGQYRSRQSWPTVTGTIVVSTVVGERAFRPHLVYHYALDSVVYTDSSFLDMPSFGGRRSRLDAASKKAAEYPVGAQVPVHVNPANPAESRLTVMPPWSIYGQLGFSGLLIILGLIAGATGLCRPTPAAPPTK